MSIFLERLVWAMMVVTLLTVGMAGYLDGQAKMEMGPATYKCSWHPEVLTLKSYRGKIAVRRYTFVDEGGMPYTADRVDYRQCEALPRTVTAAYQEASDRAARWAWGAFASFLLMLVSLYGEKHIPAYLHGKRVIAEARAKRLREEEREREREEERERSRKAHADRQRRKEERRKQMMGG